MIARWKAAALLVVGVGLGRYGAGQTAALAALAGFAVVLATGVAHELRQARRDDIDRIDEQRADLARALEGDR